MKEQHEKTDVLRKWWADNRDKATLVGGVWQVAGSPAEKSGDKPGDKPPSSGAPPGAGGK